MHYFREVFTRIRFHYKPILDPKYVIFLQILILLLLSGYVVWFLNHLHQSQIRQQYTQFVQEGKEHIIATKNNLDGLISLHLEGKVVEEQFILGEIDQYQYFVASQGIDEQRKGIMAKQRMLDRQLQKGIQKLEEP